MSALIANEDLTPSAEGTPDVYPATGRTAALQKEVDDKFAIVKASPFLLLQYHGEDVHKLMEIPDLKLVDLVISHAIRRGQKYVFFLDIGAGNFQWLNTVRAHIDNEYSACGIIFHLWGVEERRADITSTKGEPNDYTVGCVRHTEKGWCYQFHQCTSFPIENIKALLTGQTDGFDLIVSNCTFSAMRDPAHTLIQAYNLLRPNTGLLLIENFDVGLTDDSSRVPEKYTDISGKSSYPNFDIFLDALGVDYMTRFMVKFGNIHSHSIIRKGLVHITMPLDYVGDSTTQAGKKICCFQRTNEHGFLYQYMNIIIPGEVAQYPDRFFPVLNNKQWIVKERNYKNFLYMFAPIIQETRNTQAMSMQRESSGLASRMNKMYASALRDFENSKVNNFAEFYSIAHDSPVVEEAEDENVKETLKLLLYIFVKLKQSYFR